MAADMTDVLGFFFEMMEDATFFFFPLRQTLPDSRTHDLQLTQVVSPLENLFETILTD